MSSFKLNNLAFMRVHSLLLALFCVLYLIGCSSGSSNGSSSSSDSGSPAITAFAISGSSLASGVVYPGVIRAPSGTNPGTITVSVPFGQGNTALIAQFSANGTVYVGNSAAGTVKQTSGVTPNSFAAPVTYTVINANGAATYQVTVTYSQIFNSPASIAFSPDHSMAYVVNAVAAGTVFACNVVDNLLQNCVNTSATLLNTPQDIVIESVTLNGITLPVAFIANSTGSASTVTTCLVESASVPFNGTWSNIFSNCSANQLGFAANGIAFKNNKLIVIDGAGNDVYNCGVTLQESLGIYSVVVGESGSCVIQPGSNALAATPFGITLESDNVFIVNSGTTVNPVFACVYSESAGLSSCLSSNAKGSTTVVFGQATSVSFNSDSTLAFITNAVASNISPITVCQASGSMFNSCFNSGATLMNRPYSLKLSADGSHAFVANFGNSTLAVCSVSSTGFFSQCNYTGAP